jgi:hypothetical protein
LLKSHENDTSLTDPGSTNTWALDGLPEEPKKGWHLFRIKQNGANASEQTHYLSVSGFEIYGVVSGCVDELTSPVPPGTGEGNPTEKRKRRAFRSQILRHMALGHASKDSKDWKSLQQEHDENEIKNGSSTSKSDSWVDVSWAQNLLPASTRTTTAAKSGSGFKVKVVDISDPSVQASMQEVDQQKAAARQAGSSSALLRQTTLDNALRQVVLTFGRKDSEKKTKESVPEKTLTSTPHRSEARCL